MRYNEQDEAEPSSGSEALSPQSGMFVQSVERAFSVLRAFGAGRRTLGLTEIATTVGITKSAAQRFTHTLEILGYLRKDAASRRWALTPRALDIGHAYLSTDPLIEMANPHLVDLNQMCGESVNLSEPDGTDMVFLARFTSHRRLFVHMPIGTRIPMFCTASGRAYLSTLHQDEAEAIVRGTCGTAFTAHTLTDPDRILLLVDQARERGFATASEEFYLGDLNVAAPVVGRDGSALGAINISGPTSRWELRRMEAELAPLLIQTARAVSAGGPSKGQRQKQERQERK